MLASVENLVEAQSVLDIGVDIIDLKAPAAGALGALPVATVREIVTALGGRCPLSATIGDLPMQSALVLPAVAAMAATGVDYVKIGFFPGGDWAQTVTALHSVAAQGVRLVAVLFADQQPDLAYVGTLAEAGFTGVMLDTMDKRGGSLREVCALSVLRDFVAEAKAQGLLCGLAGSLRLTDIAPLLALQPDYLGFRGALCQQQQRTACLDQAAMRAVRAGFHA
jgi:uncharacterized protein (UPF0264 family)